MAHRLGLAVLATALASGGGLAVAGSAQAVGCHAFKAAVEHAGDGDVVTLNAGLVCHGTYTLPANKNPLSFTIRGAGGGATLDRTGKGTRIMSGLPNAGKQLHVTIRNLTFRNGTASNMGGGALFLQGADVSATIDRDRFLGDTAPGDSAGGAIFIQSSGSARPVVVTHSKFGNGTAAGANRAAFGGAIRIDAVVHGPSATVSGNTFDLNVAGENGGALSLVVNSPGRKATIAGNVFSRNTAHGLLGGAVDAGTNSITVRSNTFAGNRIVNTIGAGAFGGGIALTGDASVGATIDQGRNRFDGNRITRGSQTTFDAGGGGEWIDGYAVKSRGDRFTNNSIPAAAGSGAAEGGGVGIEGCSATPLGARLENAAVAGNTAGAGAHGAGAYVGGCGGGAVKLTLLDSTIAGNTTSGAASGSGLFGGPDDSLTLRNSIVAGNVGATSLAGFGAGVTASNSDACAPAVLPGAGIICAPPKLVDAAHGNVHEKTASPTVDQGSNASVPSTLKSDYEGDKRILGSAVDMGADELRPH